LASPSADALELRCPEPWRVRCDAGRLLAKLRLSGQKPSYVHPDNLIELECQDCKVRLRKDGRSVARVLHRYDFLGEHVETLVVDDLAVVSRAWQSARPASGSENVMSDWHDRAACRGMDPELWFPVSIFPRTPEEARRLRVARSTCQGCPVRWECLDFAEGSDQYGIWGGLTRDERHAAARRRSRRRARTEPALA
jgi:WhiB family redox-sensing transcriptional regulator